MVANYIKEIANAGWFVEEIEDKFDGALNMVTDDCVVYGGAIRDLVASEEITGDLDILVPCTDKEEVLNKFENSPKYMTPGSIIYEKDIMITGHRGDNDPNLIKQKKGPMLFGNKPKGFFGNPYDQKQIQKVYNFASIDGNIVQLIIVDVLNDVFDDIVNVVRNVDIICCGLFMTPYGKICEAVKGAEQDCIKKLVRVNRDSLNLTSLSKIQKRIKTIKNKGWDVAINPKQLERLIKKNKRLEEKAKENKPKTSLLFMLPWTTYVYKHSFGYIKISSPCIKLAHGHKNVHGLVASVLQKVDSPFNIESRADGGAMVHMMDDKASLAIKLIKQKIKDFVIDNKFEIKLKAKKSKKIKFKPKAFILELDQMEKQVTYRLLGTKVNIIVHFTGPIRDIRKISRFDTHTLEVDYTNDQSEFKGLTNSQAMAIERSIASNKLRTINIKFD